MPEAYWISLRLKLTCRMNAFLFRLKHIPLIKKIIPRDIYGRDWLKLIFLVLTLIRDIAALMLGRLLYLGLMVAVPVLISIGARQTMTENAVMHIFLCFAAVGFIVDNPLIDAEKDKYYSIFLLRMDPKAANLSLYFYFLLKRFLGNLLSLSLLRLIFPAFGITTAELFLAPFLVTGGKLLLSAMNLCMFAQKKKFLNAILGGVFLTIPTLGFLVLAALPLFGNTALSAGAFCAAAGVIALSGAASFVYLLKYPQYRQLSRYIFRNGIEGAAASEANLNQKIARDTDREKLQTDAQPVSGRLKGCARVNAVFESRFRKLLRKPGKRMGIIEAGGLAVIFLLSLFLPKLADWLAKELPNRLTTLLLFQCLTNRGEKITQLYFFNCDRKLLPYRFYRSPRVILEMFRLRLFSMLRNTLLPTLVMALGVTGLIGFHRADGSIGFYAAVFLVMVGESVFFTVHYLAMYYLLQPYTEALENHSFGYRVMTMAVYVTCYMLAKEELSAMRFLPIVGGVILLYVPLVLLLVRFRAPKTFRIRQE